MRHSFLKSQKILKNRAFYSNELYDFNIAGKFENLRYDTSSSQSILPPEFVKKLIDAYGLENCFFGTDFPMWDFEREAEALLSVGYSYDEYKKLFSENFKAFYGID